MVVNGEVDELTPDVVSTPSGIMKEQTDKLALGAKKCGRELLGSTSVRTQVKFAELRARYLVSIELACIPRTHRHGIKYRGIFAAIKTQQARRRDLINIISYLHFYIVTNTSTIYAQVNRYI